MIRQLTLNKIATFTHAVRERGQFQHSNILPILIFIGAVDDIAVYNRALSSAEVAQLAAVPLPSSWLTLLLDVVLFPFCRRSHKR